MKKCSQYIKGLRFPKIIEIKAHIRTPEMFLDYWSSTVELNKKCLKKRWTIAQGPGWQTQKVLLMWKKKQHTVASKATKKNREPQESSFIIFFLAELLQFLTLKKDLY